jgi:hypothetical protein
MNVLDECAAFLGDYIAASPEQIDAQTLVAAATHAIRYGVTFPRVLYTSREPSSGKTHAMMTTVSLCSNPMDCSGTSYAFQSGLMEAENTPEAPPVTLYLDEISDVTGQSGLRGANSPVTEILRKGYKRGATRSASVNRVKVEYSIFTPFLMTGLRTAVPADIRTRCIVLTMVPATPRKYFDVRESEPYAKGLQLALSGAVKLHRDDIERFRARGLHHGLTDRRLEIWEPLLAVAYALGGQRWLNRAVRAFAAIAMDEADAIPLTPRQEVLRDIAAIAEDTGDAFVGGLHLVDELRRVGSPLYDGRSDASLARLVSDSVPFPTEQRRTDAGRVRGYPTASLTALWEAENTAAPVPDVTVPDDDNPFALDDDDDDAAAVSRHDLRPVVLASRPDGTGGTGAANVSAGSTGGTGGTGGECNVLDSARVPDVESAL